MSKQNNILIVGAFGDATNPLDGQIIKTRNIFDLVKKMHKGSLSKFDTLGIRRKPWLVLDFLWKIVRCDTLIIVPCLNNLTFVFPVSYVLSKIFRFEIIHICIGGWQVEYFMGNERFRPHPLQLKWSRKIKVMLPEIKQVEIDLNTFLGFRNAELLPNFRSFDRSSFKTTDPSVTLRLVFMGRVNRKKGYATIFNFVEKLYDKPYRVSVDFYGPIEEGNKKEFLSLVNKYSSRVKYQGVLQPEDIYSTLAAYDVMLFPTTYYTEGFPGSILDAYIAGIPVIATRWKHAHEFVIEGVSGFVVPFEDHQPEFNAKIMELYEDRDKLSAMKVNARKESMKYSEEAAEEVLSKYL